MASRSRPEQTPCAPIDELVERHRGNCPRRLGGRLTASPVAHTQIALPSAGRRARSLTFSGGGQSLRDFFTRDGESAAANFGGPPPEGCHPSGYLDGRTANSYNTRPFRPCSFGAPYGHGARKKKKTKVGHHRHPATSPASTSTTAIAITKPSNWSPWPTSSPPNAPKAKIEEDQGQVFPPEWETPPANPSSPGLPGLKRNCWAIPRDRGWSSTSTVPKAHAEVATQCLEAGKHTYSEKPFSTKARRRPAHPGPGQEEEAPASVCAPDYLSWAPAIQTLSQKSSMNGWDRQTHRLHRLHGLPRPRKPGIRIRSF